MASVEELIAAANAEKSGGVSAMEGLARGYMGGQQQALERAKMLIMLDQNRREQEQMMETQRKMRQQYEQQIENARKLEMKNVGEKKEETFPHQKLKTVWEEDEKGRLSQKQTIGDDDKKPTMVFAVDKSGQAIDPFSGKKLEQQDQSINYKPVSLPGQGSTRYNPAQQSNYMDSSDNTPVYWDVATKSYLRVTDKSKPIGNIAPIKGNADAVTSASRGLVLLKNVDSFFDQLSDGGILKQRSRLIPGVRQLFNPEVERFTNELKQVGFSFGGKQLTGTEEDIVMGTFVPNVLDNESSTLAKREALKNYLAGNIDLLSAANLLGTQGQSIREVLKPYMSKNSNDTKQYEGQNSIEQQKEQDRLRSTYGY